MFFRFSGFSFVAPNFLDKCVGITKSSHLDLMTVTRPKPDEVISYNKTEGVVRISSLL